MEVPKAARTEQCQRSFILVVTMKLPLAIDLYCGLSEPKLLLRAQPAIKQLVTSGAKKPNHMALSVGDYLPCAVAFKLRSVSDFKNAILTARLAGSRQVRIPSAESAYDGVLERSARIIELSSVWPVEMESSALGARRLPCAFRRAVTSIRARRRDVKMRPTSKTISSGLGDVGLLKTPQSSCATLATK